MKTIKVIFADKNTDEFKSIEDSRKYAFNTNLDLKIGDIVVGYNYNTSMKVVEILDDIYTYCNFQGDLFKEDEDNKNLPQIISLLVKSVNKVDL